MSTVKSINIFGKEIDITCFHVDCLDEWFGLVAIIIGVVAIIIQFVKTGKTENVEAFSVLTLILICLSEGFFAVQGIIKKSWTIGATRTITFCTFLAFLIMILSIKKKGKKKDKKKKKKKDKKK